MGKILSAERMEGVVPELVARFTAAISTLPFDVKIQSDGGLRVDAAKQLEYFTLGYSKASTLEETSHGRGGAIDAAPVVNGAPLSKSPSEDASTKPYWEQYGAALKKQGLDWGGDWGWDYFHAQLPNWRSLVMPVVQLASLVLPVLFGLVLIVFILKR